MRIQILAGLTVLALAGGTTSGAMASSHRGHHWRHGHRVVGIFGGQDAGPAYGPHYYSLGPLGFTTAPPGSYSGYGAPVEARP